MHNNHPGERRCAMCTEGRLLRRQLARNSRCGRTIRRAAPGHVQGTEASAGTWYAERGRWCHTGKSAVMFCKTSARSGIVCFESYRRCLTRRGVQTIRVPTCRLLAASGWDPLVSASSSWRFLKCSALHWSMSGEARRPSDIWPALFSSHGIAALHNHRRAIIGLCRVFHDAKQVAVQPRYPAATIPARLAPSSFLDATTFGVLGREVGDSANGVGLMCCCAPQNLSSSSDNAS